MDAISSHNLHGAHQSSITVVIIAVRFGTSPCPASNNSPQLRSTLLHRRWRRTNVIIFIWANNISRGCTRPRSATDAGRREAVPTRTSPHRHRRAHTPSTQTRRLESAADSTSEFQSSWQSNPSAWSVTVTLVSHFPPTFTKTVDSATASAIFKNPFVPHGG